jgi:site-specific DNA recombinase
MNEDEQNPAVFYGRVSEDKRGKRGDSLRSQETTCRQFARMANYRIDAVFTDSMSGTRIDRPGVAAMMEFLKRHRKVGYTVIVDSPDRFARNIRGHWDLRDQLRAAGASLISPRMEFKDDADSVLVENINATVSQHASQKNAEQTVRRMKARLLNGFWTFQAPIGFEYHSVRNNGRMLRRKEPEASIIQEALEGFGSDRFALAADVMRFLKDNPLFPRDRKGYVSHHRTSMLLRNPIYAGYVQEPRWDVSLRKGQHEGLISYETFMRIQDKLNGKRVGPRASNLTEDFPLRGYVLCADCETPLTACWSKGRTSRHPYYLCPQRGCESYGKSIRRAKIEGEFETLIQSAQPNERLFGLAERMLRKWWESLSVHSKDQAKALAAQLAKIERDVDKVVERILDVSEPKVIAKFEERIRDLEQQKIATKERMAKTAQPASSFDDTLRTAMTFLANPWNLWSSGQYEQRRAVLKLMFANRLQYARKEGFRTANLALPFKVLGDLNTGFSEMARPKRFELLTPRFVVWCSIQLSYGRAGG